MEDIFKRHKKILKHFCIENIESSIAGIYSSSNLEAIEKALIECNKALLGVPYDPDLPCLGEGWSVSIDPTDSVQVRGKGFVETEFFYGTRQPDISHVPLWLFKTLLNERYFELSKEIFYPNHQLKRKGNYLNGLREGLWTEYFENGNIKHIGNYSQFKKIGLWKYYYNNGQIKEMKNHGEKMQFISKQYWYENGQIKFDWEWNKEKQQFCFTYFFESGKIRSFRYYNQDGTSS